MKTVTATAIRHRDVRGKEMYYIQFNNGTEEHVINVGEATCKRIEQMGTEFKEEEKPEPYTLELANKTQDEMEKAIDNHLSRKKR